jgi:hypothetical protein
MIIDKLLAAAEARWPRAKGVLKIIRMLLFTA